MTESIEINVRGGVASAEGGSGGSDKLGGLGFIGGRSASLLGRTIGGAMKAAIGATPAIAAILVIADVLKTAMAPALKMISAILKVLGAIFMPIGIIIMMLLRPVLMILLPILKFMWLIWRPHMMKIAHAAQNAKQTGDLLPFYDSVMAELSGFISDIFKGVGSEALKAALKGIFDIIIGLVGAVKANLIVITNLIDSVFKTHLSDTIEELFGSPGSGTGIIGGLEKARDKSDSVFSEIGSKISEAGNMASKTWEDVLASLKGSWARNSVENNYVGANGMPLGGMPTVGGYPLDVSKILGDLGEQSTAAANALNSGDTSLVPQVKLAGTSALKTSENLNTLSREGIAPALVSFISLIPPIGLLTAAITDAVQRINSARISSSGGSYEDTVRQQVVARGWYTR